MYILGIDTTGPFCSVAVKGPDGVILKSTQRPMEHLKKVDSLIAEAMKETNISMANIDGIAVSAGPGSFTGIRIGIATARALGQALAVPVVPLCSLEIFCQKAEARPVAVIFNARRMQVYGAVFYKGEALLAPGPYLLDEVLNFIDEMPLKDEVIFYGDGVDAYEAYLEGRRLSPVESRYQTAAMVCEMAFKVIDDSDFKEEDYSYGKAIPQYMRKAEAQQKLEDGTLAKQRAEKLAKLLES